MVAPLNRPRLPGPTAPSLPARPVSRTPPPPVMRPPPLSHPVPAPSPTPSAPAARGVGVGSAALTFAGLAPLAWDVGTYIGQTAAGYMGTAGAPPNPTAAAASRFYGTTRYETGPNMQGSAAFGDVLTALNVSVTVDDPDTSRDLAAAALLGAAPELVDLYHRVANRVAELGPRELAAAANAGLTPFDWVCRVAAAASIEAGDGPLTPLRSLLARHEDGPGPAFVRSVLEGTEPTPATASFRAWARAVFSYLYGFAPSLFEAFAAWVIAYAAANSVADIDVPVIVTNRQAWRASQPDAWRRLVDIAAERRRGAITQTDPGLAIELPEPTFTTMSLT